MDNYVEMLADLAFRVYVGTAFILVAAAFFLVFFAGAPVLAMLSLL